MSERTASNAPNYPSAEARTNVTSQEIEAWEYIFGETGIVRSPLEPSADQVKPSPDQVSPPKRAGRAAVSSIIRPEDMKQLAIDEAAYRDSRASARKLLF